MGLGNVRLRLEVFSSCFANKSLSTRLHHRNDVQNMDLASSLLVDRMDRKYVKPHLPLLHLCLHDHHVMSSYPALEVHPVTRRPSAEAVLLSLRLHDHCLLSRKGPQN
jgi:hypothetical protein